MRAVLQETLYNPDPNAPRGDCWRAAVASVIEYPLAKVPHFVQEHEDTNGDLDWFVSTWNWLVKQGWLLKQCTIQEARENSDRFHIVTGRSYRFENGYHAVVYHGWNLAHDPHPTGNGVYDINGIYYLEKS